MPSRLYRIDFSVDSAMTLTINLLVLIADDSDIVRLGIRNLLRCSPEEWVICGEAADGKQAVVQAMELKPDVILLYLSIPQLSGMEVARPLRKSLPASVIVIMSEQEPTVLRHIADSLNLQYWAAKSALGTELVVHSGKLPPANLSQHEFLY
jgi:two-component system response regulator YesN